MIVLGQEGREAEADDGEEERSGVERAIDMGIRADREKLTSLPEVLTVLDRR